jgi:cold shock CspA family protein
LGVKLVNYNKSWENYIIVSNQGKITKWIDDRGFGFITPIEGSTPVFVHISAFKKGQKRPAGNELVLYDVVNDSKRGLRAQNVVYFGISKSSLRKKVRFGLNRLIVVLILAGLSVYAMQDHLFSRNVKSLFGVKSMMGLENATKFQCQGKQYCSEMTSCEEAMFYLKNCPGVKIDGDGDGIPCESQLCGH